MDFPLLIFTDLDGTLLDHHTYSFQGAADTLVRLRQLSIPLILTSSKTRAEIHKLQQQLGIKEAFISENGGGIFFPSQYPAFDFQQRKELTRFREYRGMVFGRTYSSIRKIFSQFMDAYKIKGFGDMSVPEIMERTGLEREDAEFAARRDFTEPFVFLDQPRPDDLQDELAVFGLKITRGGRFYHMMGVDQDKGRAVKETVRLFQAGYPRKITTIGLGDALNDYPLLKSVDIPVLIPRPDGTFEKMEIAGLRRASLPGSRGWGMIIADILDKVAKET